RPNADGIQECVADDSLVERPDARVDAQHYVRASLVSLRLQELVVRGSAAKACRETCFQHSGDVEVEERHPARRELLEAPDPVEVPLPAVTLQRTAAPAPRHVSVVTDADVEQNHRRTGPKGREQ